MDRWKERAGTAAAAVFVVLGAGWGLWSCVADSAADARANCRAAAEKAAAGIHPTTNVLSEDWCQDHLRDLAEGDGD
jgi:hypothetical protein